jgi:drug/metabolite transporter (DMT)-like permease
MAVGEAAVMAPIDYTRLVFAVIIGYLLFGEIPNGMTMAGATIVIVSTVYITLRESQLGKPKLPGQREE